MITRGIKTLMQEANAEIETMSVESVISIMNDDNVQLIDIRDVRELWREGTVPGAYHAPRGMLEFWVDPESQYHKELFSSGKKFVFYCAAGARSALATKAMQDMGLKPVAHIDGGFGAWKKANAPIDQVDQD